MAGSANILDSQPAKPPRLALVAWREILIANGFVSLLFGLVALGVVTQYAPDAHRWVRESSASEFAGVVRFGVLVYILYALTTLGIGMAWLAVSVYSSRRQVEPAPAAPAAEPGAAPGPPI